MLKKIKKIKRKHFIMMAFAKLIFYVAVALFAKTQFDEIGNRPDETDNTILESVMSKKPSKQTAENQKEDYKLLPFKEISKQ